MSKIKHVGNHFILGKQGRDVAKISETQLLECLEILKTEIASDAILSGADARVYETKWSDVIEFLQDRRTREI